MIKRYYKTLVALCLVLSMIFLMGGCAKKEEAKLNLYAAAGLKKPMDTVIAKFQQEKGVEVVVNYGPSGGLYTQIKEGQPCDLYFSADWLYIEKLQNEQMLSEEGKKFLRDNIVLVVSKKGQEKVKSSNDLVKKDVTLTVANPAAPAGAYAEAGLKKMGLWDKINGAGTLKARPATVNQVAIMVKSDEVDAGFVYSSVANGNGLDPAEVIPNSLTGDVIFGAGIIKGGNEKLAGEFYSFAAQNATEFTKYGWTVYE